MTNYEWIEMFELIPPEQYNQLVITLQNGTDLVIDTLFKFEPNYLVMRGRQGGSIDESRAFFVPYSQMLYLRLERVVKLKELYAFFNEEVPDHLANEGNAPGEKSKAAPDSKEKPKPTASGAGASADGSLKTNLLERIRQARATSINSARQQSKGS